MRGSPAVEALVAEPPQRGPSLRRRGARFLRSAPTISLAIIAFVSILGATANLTVGHIFPSVTAVNLNDYYLPPWPLSESVPSHPLGTDRLGRDVLSRMILGAQVSLSAAFSVIAAGASVGALVGIIAGYVGGWVDRILMRIVDVFLSFPAILVALALVVTVGASFWMVVAVLAFQLWPQFARVVRAETLTWKEQAFVVHARITGTPTRNILLWHILPNVLNSIIVLATLQVGWVIIAESALSFLGAGVPPPTPTWGNMLADGRAAMARAWWLTVLPGAAITLVVLSFNLIGNWLRDTLDPRLRQIAP